MTAYQKLYKDALQAGKERRYEDSRNLLTRLLAETDEFPDALLYLGRTLHALGRYPEAVLYLKRFLQYMPKSGAGRFFLGRTLLAMDMPFRALPYLRAASELQPELSQVNGLLGYTYLKLKRSDLAMNLFEKAVKQDPQNKSLYTAYLNTLLVEAIRAFSNGERDYALGAFEFLQEQGYNHVLIHVYLAMLKKDMDDFNGAIKEFDSAIELSPDDSMLRVQKASLLLRTGKMDEAYNVINNSGSELVGELTDSLNNPIMLERFIAFRMFQDGEYAKTIHQTRNILEKEPEDGYALFLLAEAYRNLGNLDEAEYYLKRAIRQDGEQGEMIFSMLMIHWAREEFRLVLKDLDFLEQLGSNEDILVYFRALSMSRCGYPSEQTLPALQQAIEQHGPDPFLMTSLGKEYIRSGMPELAEKWFIKSLEIVPDFSQALTSLVELYREQPGSEKAMQFFEDYLEVHPEESEIRKALIEHLLAKEEYEAAANHILREKSRTESYRPLRKTLAFCYRNTERYHEAANLYLELLREDPHSVELLRSYVHCLDKVGNRDRAIQLITAYESEIKDTQMLSIMKGVLLYHSGKYEDALKCFRSVLDTDPNHYRALKNIAVVYRKRGIKQTADQFEARAEEAKQNAKKTANL
ncbi:MAG: tetratricopeptide repeat protein [Spirochaetales bacterium]|nr:tetratricopeptide repeat protein [Spirochaetales bacterium]